MVNKKGGKIQRNRWGLHQPDSSLMYRMAKTSRCPLSTLQEADLNHLPPVKKLHFGDWLLYTRILACFAQITIQFQSFWAKQQTLFTTTGFSQNRGFYQSTSSSVALPLQIQSPLCQGTGERLPRQSILPTQFLLQHQLNAKPNLSAPPKI